MSRSERLVADCRKPQQVMSTLTVLLVGLIIVAGASAQEYKHKSDAEIGRMSPSERVDEYANEQAYHKYDVLDEHERLIKKYIWRDGLTGLPRIIEIIDEYDPTKASGSREHRGERFDAMWMLLGDLDNRVVRLRSSPEGRRAMDALDRAIRHMRAAGSGKPDQHEWENHGRFDLALMVLDEAKGIGPVDEDIRDTLWVKYRIRIADHELAAFSNFLVARDATYPGWSDTDFIKDRSRLNEAGNPLQVYIMKKPEPFFDAYKEFKKKR